MADVIHGNDSEPAGAGDGASPEVRRFFADAITKAGGTAELAEQLAALGFCGYGDKPFNSSTIRAWRAGQYAPGSDILFALARFYDMSLDSYAFEGPLKASLEEIIRDHEQRLRDLERSA